MKMPLGHVLVIRPGALGDAVLTLPALHALRLAGAESIIVLGSPASWGFLRSSHDSPRVRDFSSSEWLGLFAEGVPFGAAAQAALARTKTAVVYLNGETESVEKALKDAGVQQILVVDPPRLGVRVAQTHAARALLEPLVAFAGKQCADAALAIDAAANDPFLAVEDVETVRALARLGYDAPPGDGFVAIHPGSGGRFKCWPAARYAELVTKLAARGVTPLVFFGPADETTQQEFEARMPPGVRWECVANHPLREVLALLSCARCFVGNDAGVTHLAARACPAVALFGPTDPAVWAPLGRRVIVVQAPGGVLGELTVAEVLAAVGVSSEPRA